ncbi:hypothetical protein EAG_00688, partial [Camponotus floridanus]
ITFEDGLEVIPNNWLSKNLMKTGWFNFTNNEQYDKVKLIKKLE